MKLLRRLTAALIIILVFVPTVALAESAQVSETADLGEINYVLDDYELLEESERTELNEVLRVLNDKYDFDIVIATVYSLNGKTAEDFAYDLYSEHDEFRENGIILLISMEYRDWAMQPMSDASRDMFPRTYQLYMSDEFLSYLSNGYYYDAFSTFIELCEQKLSGVEADYDEEHYEDVIYEQEKGDKILYVPGLHMDAIWIPIAFAGGILIAFIILSSMKAKHKSVSFKTGASQYLKENSFSVNEQQDIFLYRTVSKTPIPKDTSSSSFGGGGGGGSFGGGGSSGSRGGTSGKF